MTRAALSGEATIGGSWLIQTDDNIWPHCQQKAALGGKEIVPQARHKGMMSYLAKMKAMASWNHSSVR
ncbi:MAG: hypothetical protein ACREBR_03350 [bacterium]